MHPLVLVPGDPARAMAIATAQLEEPRMFNHRRGLWGYSGRTAAGTGFVIQSTGMGGPSAAIVCEELLALGAEVLLRVGTCGAIDPSVKLGDVIVADAAICDDSASRGLGAGERVAPDRALTDALYAHAGEHLHSRTLHRGPIASVDLFYDPDGTSRYARLAADGALAIEMEAATVLALTQRPGLRGACILGVTDELHGDERARLAHEDIVKLGDLIGAIAIRALAEHAA